MLRVMDISREGSAKAIIINGCESVWLGLWDLLGLEMRKADQSWLILFPDDQREGGLSVHLNN